MATSSAECIAALDAAGAALEPAAPLERGVTVRLTESGEKVEVTSASGDVRVEILLTDAGPVIRLSGARLELAATDSVAVRCRRFEVRASEEAAVRSGGAVRISGEEMRVRTQGDIHMDGDYIRLNCAAAEQAQGDKKPVTDLNPQT